MEGDADGNNDGKITAGEMQEYLSDKVSRQAMSMSRKQDTQLVGDANRVLMGRWYLFCSTAFQIMYGMTWLVSRMKAKSKLSTHHRIYRSHTYL